MELSAVLVEERDMATFSTRIKEERMKKGLSQPQLAEEIGLTKQTISLWERGVRRPDFETMEKLADYFGVSLGYLIGTTDDPTAGENDPNVGIEDEAIQEIETLATKISQLSEDSKRIISAAVREAYRVDREMERLQDGWYIVNVTAKRRR